MDKYILVINPGSTSTKFGVFKNEEIVLEEKIEHSSEELKRFERISDQFSFRYQFLIDTIRSRNFDVSLLNAVCGRGGLLRPIKSGTYSINQAILDDLRSEKYGAHASNLGALIAHQVSLKLNIPAFIVDPVVVDEYEDVARISGMPMIERVSVFHALNQKAVARVAAKHLNKKYEEINLIVVHMGGGISVGAHEKGRVIDVNSALDGDGPLTPERSGSVPIGPLIKLCYSNQYTFDELVNLNHGRGGLTAYLKTNNAREVIKRIQSGDEYAKLIYDAMIYQIAKEIGAYATVLKGDIDLIVLTGGLAHEQYLITELTNRIKFLGNIFIYPGEEELLSLAQGALRVLNGEEISKIY